MSSCSLADLSCDRVYGRVGPLSVIDCNTDSVIVPGMLLGDFLYDIQLDPIRQRVFVTGDTNKVYVLRDVEGGVVEEPAPSGPAPTSGLQVQPTSGGYEVSYSIASPCRVDLSIHDQIGREVRQLVAEEQAAGQHRVTAKFPKSEVFGLTGQMRRAAASIPMNLAEGAARAGAKEFAQFVNVAVGSCEEVRYQLHLAEALGYLARAEQQTLDRRYESVKKMLAKLYGAVSRKPMASPALVYELYGLTGEEIGIDEGGSR